MPTWIPLRKHGLQLLQVRLLWTSADQRFRDLHPEANLTTNKKYENTGLKDYLEQERESVFTCD